MCNEYPLIPQFDIEKLGYAGVYLFFLFTNQNMIVGTPLIPTIHVLKYQTFSDEIFSFFTNKKFSVYCMGVFS